jgi:hypothetical protein
MVSPNRRRHEQVVEADEETKTTEPPEQTKVLNERSDGPAASASPPRTEDAPSIDDVVCETPVPQSSPCKLAVKNSVDATVHRTLAPEGVIVEVQAKRLADQGEKLDPPPKRLSKTSL